MKARLPLALVLAASLAGGALAGVQGGGSGQDTKTKESAPKDTTPKDPSNGTFAKADATLQRFDQIDVLGKLLPVLMTKEQIRALLPAIEKARAKELEIKLLDAAEIAKLEPDATKAVDGAIASGAYPTKELQLRIAKVTGALALRRQVAFGEMVDTVYDACVKTLDAGQLKVMANTLKPESYDPRFKEATMSEADKQKFFVRIVLLNGTAYDLLLRMAKEPK